jgi:hypothetical protein
MWLPPYPGMTDDLGETSCRNRHSRERDCSLNGVHRLSPCGWHCREPTSRQSVARFAERGGDIMRTFTLPAAEFSALTLVLADDGGLFYLCRAVGRMLPGEWAGR